MLKDTLQQFNLNYDDYQISTFGSGLINKTYKLTAKQGTESYILQQINKSVFKSPLLVTKNIQNVGEYLLGKYPNYLFVGLIPSLNGEFSVKDTDGEFYKLSKFIKNSLTINTVDNCKQAHEAALKFGEFTSLLKDFDINDLHYTLTNFHNLTFRFEEFEKQLSTADKVRLIAAKDAIDLIYKHQNIVDTYNEIVKNNLIPIRVVHHDTKINNILFDEFNSGLCVIDLDTIMPGYYISDLGDMFRTYLCPVDEEEQDLTKIKIRADIFIAIATGYLKKMGEMLTPSEKRLFVYAGKFMIYMQAIRFLTDFLANDEYYGEKYPGHNLARAKNQLTLLEQYVSSSSLFEKMVADELGKAVAVQ
ncbi:phosphotransferase enzyme family protein [Pedobacter cryotolerans]|uniref:Aminoglycoside phosphotransferase family protein n=1 Tax=Pedobacter cryotolerans TaxID=2571270 RepID=A0A4U1C779_9SPHI|nr:phosphotransferase [Pedobacter cryotolerans]TKC01294.1 aminoglycoside phosphotransferase family protein [Pedobacter cryotolerans]